MKKILMTLFILTSNYSFGRDGGILLSTTTFASAPLTAELGLPVASILMSTSFLIFGEDCRKDIKTNNSSLTNCAFASSFIATIEAMSGDKKKHARSLFGQEVHRNIIEHISEGKELYPYVDNLKKILLQNHEQLTQEEALGIIAENASLL